MSAVIFVLLVGAIYLLPTIVAGVRDHNSTPAIFVVNILAGWTGVLWLVALVWSLTGNTAGNREIVIQAGPGHEPPRLWAPPAAPPRESRIAAIWTSPWLVVFVFLGLIVLMAVYGHSASGETLNCSTWQGIRTCSSADGYMSHESTWNGITNGDDNQGNHWTGSRWGPLDTTTITPPPGVR